MFALGIGLLFVFLTRGFALFWKSRKKVEKKAFLENLE
jgi:hypothetical protein